MTSSSSEMRDPPEAARLVREFMDSHAYDADRSAFRGAQFDEGLAWVHFPKGLGGLGLERAAQSVVDEEFRARGIPQSDLALNPIGLGMAAPTLHEWATEEQQAAHLRRIFTAEEVWCQMFSEPTAGSDVAGIATRAVRDGDTWVINGQKVWTTLAHKASYSLLLARTDPEAEKHRGLSYFFLDMRSPGVEVRPLFQLTGDAEFNEVFLTDVRLPAENLLGAAGDGWRVAMTTLMNERAAIGGSGGSAASTLLGAWRERADALDPVVRAGLRDQVVRLWIESEASRRSARRAAALARAGAQGPEGSIAKLSGAETTRRVAEFVLGLQGSGGLLHPDGYPMVRTDQGHGLGSPSRAYLRSRALTIEGGTSEVMRNMIGERILGLPSDMRADKGVPWSRIPR